ncbi:unnamed protein product, partial [Meganyctiphanes norvegica]
GQFSGKFSDAKGFSPVDLVSKLSDAVVGSVSGKQSKIVGGHDATLGEAPWQVALVNAHGSLFCGGTLLSPWVVITAAHCMIFKNFTVRLGGLDRRDLPLMGSVKEVLEHAEYNSSTIDNDIALVILDVPVNAPPMQYAEPARLPNTDDDEVYANETVLISGWGTIRSGNYPKPNNLLAAEVQVFPQDMCKASYNNHYTDNMICAAGDNYTKDSCQGDSGGPLVHKGETSSILLGITSWGMGCAQQGYPGVYTKVSNYVSWIEEKACSSNACLNRTVVPFSLLKYFAVSKGQQ